MMRVNLIPMAGDGQRFKTAGYKEPKPLLETDGLPMIIRACDALPEADKYIFVCRKSHLQDTDLENMLRQRYRNTTIMKIEHLSEGQAATCLLAKDDIPDEAMLTIGPCDNDMIYDGQKLNQLIADPQIDGWVYTFRGNPAAVKTPNMYGWVRTSPHSNTIINVSCKQPISNNVINDHAVVGAFGFKKAKIFFDAIEEMVRKNSRIGNEFYVDVAINFAINAGRRFEVFETQQYICWGTPEEYEIYRYWAAYFKKRQ